MRIRNSLTLICCIYLLATWPALAAPATWSPGALYQLAEPYLLSVFGVVWTLLLGMLAAWLKQKWGWEIDQAAVAKINIAAANAAGRILAGQEGRFAGMSIDVHSKLIADEIPKLLENSKAAVDRLGMTPDRVGALILAKVGQVQATALGSAASPPASVAGAAP